MAANQEDAQVLLPLRVPQTAIEKAGSVWRVGKFSFRADFDSGNLQDVRQGHTSTEFQLWTSRDCQDTHNERGTRSWFYYGVSGHSAGDFIIMTIMNLNKQGRLYSQDYRPWCWSATMSEWLPVSTKASYRREGDDFELRFSHKFDSTDEVFFAFAIPFSYTDTQTMLRHLDSAFEDYQQLPADSSGGTSGSSNGSRDRDSAGTGGGSPSGTGVVNSSGSGGAGHHAAHHAGSHAPSPSPSPASSSSSSRCSRHQEERQRRILYRRQMLTKSLNGRRVDVITITDCHGASPSGEVEPALEGLWPDPLDQPVPLFRGKKVFFVSSRVHPGETPASHMFNGLLAFLLRQNDARAAALRRQFVFKLVPLVNPDGVFHGYYRTDTLGQNLNRFYLGSPDQALQPSVFAIKRLLMFYAQQGLLEFYLDLHAHANKKGVFIFGNSLEGEQAVQSLMYSKLVALNSPIFDFYGCNFTEKNMSRPDKDGVSKEGAGRVALFRETGLTHLYTIEANYNTARMLNAIAPATGDHNGRASPPCGKRFPPKFTASVIHGVGRAFALAALDLRAQNPWSRVPSSEHRSLEGVRSWILSCLRAPSEARAAHMPALSEASVDSARDLAATTSAQQRSMARQSSLSRASTYDVPVRIYEPPSRSQSHGNSATGHTAASGAGTSGFTVTFSDADTDGSAVPLSPPSSAAVQHHPTQNGSLHAASSSPALASGGGGGGGGGPGTTTGNPPRTFSTRQSPNRKSGGLALLPTIASMQRSSSMGSSRARSAAPAAAAALTASSSFSSRHGHGARTNSGSTRPSDAGSDSGSAADAGGPGIVARAARAHSNGGAAAVAGANGSASQQEQHGSGLHNGAAGLATKPGGLSFSGTAQQAVVAAKEAPPRPSGSPATKAPNSRGTSAPLTEWRIPLEAPPGPAPHQQHHYAQQQCQDADPSFSFSVLSPRTVSAALSGSAVAAPYATPIMGNGFLSMAKERQAAAPLHRKVPRASMSTPTQEMLASGTTTTGMSIDALRTSMGTPGGGPASASVPSGAVEGFMPLIQASSGLLKVVGKLPPTKSSRRNSVTGLM